MQYKQWESTGISYAFKLNLLDDVLDLDRFDKRSFKDFKELLRLDKERQAKRLAKKIYTDFLKLVAQDLIVNNDMFVMPMKGFGYIKVSNTANPNREDYVYDIESDGKIWCPRLRVDQEIQKKNKRHYKVRFNQTLRIQMADMILKGHKYV